MYVSKQLPVIWQKCIQRASLAKGIMIYHYNRETFCSINGDEAA